MSGNSFNQTTSAAIFQAGKAIGGDLAGKLVSEYLVYNPKKFNPLRPKDILDESVVTWTSLGTFFAVLKLDDLCSEESKDTCKNTAGIMAISLNICLTPILEPKNVQEFGVSRVLIKGAYETLSKTAGFFAGFVGDNYLLKPLLGEGEHNPDISTFRQLINTATTYFAIDSYVGGMREFAEIVMPKPGESFMGGVIDPLLFNLIDRYLGAEIASDHYSMMAIATSGQLTQSIIHCSKNFEPKDFTKCVGYATLVKSGITATGFSLAMLLSEENLPDIRDLLFGKSETVEAEL
ncbi:MAG: hypothetical protein RLN62_05770 [Rickettsiales bacterium]